MTEDEAKPYAKPIPNWIPETRTVIVCWMMFSTWIILMSLMIFGTPKGDNGQLLNTMIGIYAGTGFVVSIMWWMGDAKGTDSNNKMKDSMSDAVRPPLPAAAAPDPWWNRLTDAERTAITTSTDQRVKDFVAAPVTSKPLPDDLAYLVTKGLLTPERSKALQSA